MTPPPAAPVADPVADPGAAVGLPAGAAVPTAHERRAWRLLLRAHAEITRTLETELLAACGLPLATFDVLVQLSEAPEGRLRMSELAERVLLSRSGLTRLVDRLEREGYVARASCPLDARGTHAVLTPAGRAALAAAAPTHLRGVARRVFDRLDDRDVADLDRVLAKLVDRPAAG